jgi:hypothetical protein
MELWVRSQDLTKLVKTKTIYTIGVAIHSNCGWLGDYATERVGL